MNLRTKKTEAELAKILNPPNEIKKEVIPIPAGVRYVGDWVGEDSYNLEKYPFQHILNKVLTGCGFTEYCIRNQQNVVLCSPRKMLLENKEAQHPEANVYYARNEIDESIVNYERGFTVADSKRAAAKMDAEMRKKVTEEEEKAKAARIMGYKEGIKNHVLMCSVNHIPCKILVTYDSFRHVKEALTELTRLDDFQIVIDEFQSILVDCKFKSNTELELLYLLKGIDRVCFVSATPMLDRYLLRLEEFKDLPYFEFDWTSQEPSRIIKPNLNVHSSENINKDIVKVIYSFKEGKFEKERFYDNQGQICEIESNEAVLYVNSVTLICSMISRCELLPEQCNVLCARTEENETKVRKAFNTVYKKMGKKFRLKKEDKVIGHVPVYGEPHKMFTFCTRTVYLGADFYSTCARSFIFCNSNIDCLSVDISMDLPQILGRQRLTENPWKNSADLFIKSTILKLKREDFDRESGRKIMATNSLLSTYDILLNSPDKSYDQVVLAEKYESDTVANNYKRDYVAVNRHNGSKPMPAFNQLMLVSELRAFDIQQMDYIDRVSIFNTLQERGFCTVEVNDELKYFESLKTYPEKMEYVCKLEKELDKDKFILFLNSIPKSFKNYFVVLGPEVCKAHRYRLGEMEKEYQRRLNNQGVTLEDRIYETFHVGERILNSKLKGMLAKIYEASGYQATAKANDINNWYKTKVIRILDKETGKRDYGLELLSRKKS